MKDASCLFCNPTDPTLFGENQIFGGERFHVVAGIGQNTENDGYVVLFPSEHVPCLAAMERKDIVDFSLLLETTIDALGGPVTISEHGVVGNAGRHAHMHVVPAVLDLRGIIRADFPAAEIDPLGSMDNLVVFEPKHETEQPLLNLAKSFSENARRGMPEDYFLVSEGGKLWACWNIKAGHYYLRTKTAELLNPSECRGRVVDWHNFLQSERDRELRLQTVARLKPHFL
jgi:diadenosine tetraphosphate (Ap4A) HIT family hydrolase